MILEVSSVEDIKSTITSKIANNISQIIRFNAVKHRRKQDVTVSRHSAKREPPLPVSIGLMVYNKTRRRKKIVDHLAAEGLSINYDRVNIIQENIATQLCSKYNRGGYVCPPITIFQHCNANENIEVENFFIDQNNADLSSLYLPEEYASILPTPGGKPEPPTYLHESANTVSSENGLSQGWVDKLSKFTDDIPLADRLSFSAYFSNNIELIHGHYKKHITPTH